MIPAILLLLRLITWDLAPECPSDAPLPPAQAQAADALRARLGAGDDGRDIVLGPEGTP